MAQPGWLNQNANRAYPFQKGTVDQPASGPFTLRNLEDDIIVDAGFVMGARSQFDPLIHSVYLYQLRRQGSRFYYEFHSDAPELYGVSLTFTRQLGDPNYTVEFLDSGITGLSDSSISDSTGICDEPVWSGFLVTGNMDSLALLLPIDNAIDQGTDGAIVEPALIQTMAGAFVTKIGLANDDRTRATAPEDCDPIEFPPEAGEVHVSDPCIRGVVRFVAGYNAVIRQSRADNSIILGAAVGAGAGQPCETLPLFDGDIPPVGSTLREGGPSCTEVLRTINGQAGPNFNLIAGSGVTITPDPSNYTVRINVNMTGLAVCASASSISESC